LLTGVLRITCLSRRVTIQDVPLSRGDRQYSLRDRRGAGRLFALVYAVYWHPPSPDRGDRSFRGTWTGSQKRGS
jgi:hypothetical protein